MPDHSSNLIIENIPLLRRFLELLTRYTNDEIKIHETVESIFAISKAIANNLDGNVSYNNLRTHLLEVNLPTNVVEELLYMAEDIALYYLNELTLLNVINSNISVLEISTSRLTINVSKSLLIG